MNFRKNCGLGVLVAVALFFTLQPGCVAGELPVAGIPAPSFRFDPVADGQEVLHDFVIINSGDAPLNISKVKTG